MWIFVKSKDLFVNLDNFDTIWISGNNICVTNANNPARVIASVDALPRIREAFQNGVNYVEVE